MQTLLKTLLILTLLFAYSQALRAQDPAERVTRFNHSLTLEASGDYSGALKELESLDTAAKNDYLICLRLGWLSYKTGDYKQSGFYYRQSSAIAGERSVEALLGLTLPLAAQEDWDEVVAIYRQILRMDAENYTANLRLGQILLARGDYAEAERYLGRALERFPGEYEANLSTGWNRLYLGRSHDARVLFERALMLSPGDTSAQSGLSRLK